MTTIERLDAIAPLAATSDVWFLDIWGVLHNGISPFAATVDACQKFRDGGGLVILVSNAPRPRDSVVAQLDRIGVPRTAYDAVVSSGDVSKHLIQSWNGKRILHIGPERDRPLFDSVSPPPSASPSDCDVVVCTGLHDDETETPANYADTLAALKGRAVPMICANPDIKVERGGQIVYCAGAIAAAYEAIGGDVTYAGKPYAPVYEMALGLAGDLKGRAIAKDRVIAIGDGVATDIDGAIRFGIRAVFVASGVHVKRGEAVDAAAVRLFENKAGKPVAVMSELAW